MFRNISKAVFDISLIILTSPIWGPLVFLIGLLLYWADGHPILFVQERIGKGQCAFRLVKFRTMKDGNVHRFGRFLRRTSLDELPELFNVVVRDMSLVGPRPLLPEYLPYYTERQQRRHQVLPGITGMAQIEGRNDLPWASRFELDLVYVEQQSLLTDVKVLLKTPFVVLSGKGSGCSNPEQQTKFSEETEKKRQKES